MYPINLLASHNPAYPLRSEIFSKYGYVLEAVFLNWVQREGIKISNEKWI